MENILERVKQLAFVLVVLVGSLVFWGVVGGLCLLAAVAIFLNIAQWLV